MRDKSILLLAALGLTFAGWGICHAGEHPGPEAGDRRDIAASPDWSLWLPSESWAGGEQYDPRLEQTVKFWGAGMPLRDVFGGVKEQTGVEIGFWPPGDDNERICVNLYLNPDDPPTLRELMAQLRWVTDCGFGCTPEVEERRYALLRTSAAEGALARMERRAAAEDAAQWAARDRAMAELRVAAFERLAELEEALSLSRDEAIRRYRGRDDLLLLVLVDPARRLAVEFLLGIGGADREMLRQEGSLSREWEEWSEQQRGLLRHAMQPCLDRWAERAPLRGGKTIPHWDDWQWVERQGLSVGVSIDDDGGFSVRAWMAEDPEYDDIIRAIAAPYLHLVMDPRLPESVRPEFEVELRKMLGEELTKAEESNLISALRWPVKAEGERRPLEEQLARYCSLSEEAESALAAVSLAVMPWDECGLWQVEEAVGAATGLHVVSDCFWQPPRAAEEVLLYLEPGGDWQSALNVLRAITVAQVDFSHHLPAELESYSPDVVAYEWGNAGDFLRFRNVERALWRAALLPREVEETLNAWVDVRIPEAIEVEAADPPIQVHLDLREFSQLAGRLTVPQRRWGGRLIYRDPTDQRNAYRHSFREIAIQRLRADLGWYLLIARLNEDQWRMLQDEGLRWGTDVQLGPTFSTQRHGMGWGQFRRLHEGDLLQLVRTETEDGGEARLSIVRENRMWESIPLAASMRVEPKSTERLVELPEGPASD